ncbi:DUF222 domain-containing protein [Cryobacterium sp. PAMC25264]|uniref:DUF222 domain-containing protein n=1 Tax=Cryobacterium sp. PAMC25264 TaxID=2861288 RepID=UPI001C62BB86|nr:DUF222 domain-containing protein [Cryobacterium sp. PAMC25264]QYF73184.1 hypothetical protein KY500_15770 [Cryobacterium sp. PAMC25264]
MSSPDQAPPPTPDDDDYSPESAPPGTAPTAVTPTAATPTAPAAPASPDDGPAEPDAPPKPAAAADLPVPAHPADLVELAEGATPAPPGEPTESAEPTEGSKATDRAEPVEPTPPDEPAVPDEDEPYAPNVARDEFVRTELTRRTELVAAEARLIAQAQARQAEHLADLQCWSEDPHVSSRLHNDPDSIRTADRNTATLTVYQARAAAYSRWEDGEVARRTIVSELACLLKLAERAVERLLDQSLWLLSTPAAFQALSAGEISYRHATVLIDQMRTLPDEDQAAFVEAVLPAARALPVGRFNDRARRVRERQHPESIATRNKNAFADRRSYWEAAPDGMGWLHWYGTAHDTKAAYDRIDSMAVSLKRPTTQPQRMRQQARTRARALVWARPR